MNWTQILKSVYRSLRVDFSHFLFLDYSGSDAELTRKYQPWLGLNSPDLPPKCTKKVQEIRVKMQGHFNTLLSKNIVHFCNLHFTEKKYFAAPPGSLTSEPSHSIINILSTLCRLESGPSQSPSRSCLVMTFSVGNMRCYITADTPPAVA